MSNNGRSAQILENLSYWMESHSYPPSLQELAEMSGMASRSQVHGLLVELRAAGLVEWEDGKPRTLRVVG